MQSKEFDVVIMGAGFAGICQARHLLLKMPHLRVALVDPRPAERRDKDMKIGESMVEIAALFVCKELGLHEYMIEQHTPKQGLNFHWPKKHDQTASLDDYVHSWIVREAPIPSFHMNRAKFERDVLRMAIAQGATYIHGHVLDFDLTPGDAVTTVTVKTDAGELTLHARHVIDAAGRRFLIGRKTDNLIMGPDNLYGVNTGSAWVRVRGVDRTLFDDGVHPETGTTSRYYCTNHWFGHGHWLWMIPSCNKTMELSVGVVNHHDVIPGEAVNTREKFYAFLEANHNLLHKIVRSGEAVDFFYWPRLSHRSKRMFSPDNWYVIGDAAYIIDAFYSYGSTTIALAVESVTEIIRAKLAGESDAEEKREAYNSFNLCFARIANILIRDHAKHLGHASVMSWRIYFEYMWWFGLNVPMYFGKWHLDPKFIKTYLWMADGHFKPGGLFENVYETFTEIVAKGGNIGLLDPNMGDQLFGYRTTKHFDHFIENAKVEPRKVNVFRGIAWTSFYNFLWYVKLQWRARGLRGLLKPANVYHAGRLLGLAAYAGMGNLVHRLKNRGVPANSSVARMRQQARGHRRPLPLQDWHETGDESGFAGPSGGFDEQADQPAERSAERLTSAAS